jgi:translation initiation factor 1
LPLEICACKAIEREKGGLVTIREVPRKFKKMVTLVHGIPSDALDRTAKELKTKLACGGSAKDGGIVLQGRHKGKVKELLLKMGYTADNIMVK